MPTMSAVLRIVGIFFFMIALKNLYIEETPFNVEFEGNEIPAVICTNAVTALDLSNINVDTDDAQSVIEPLSKYYKSIDVCLEEGGERVVTTTENLALFPPALLWAMLKAIPKAREAKKKK